MSKLFAFNEASTTATQTHPAPHWTIQRLQSAPPRTITRRKWRRVDAGMRVAKGLACSGRGPECWDWSVNLLCAIYTWEPSCYDDDGCEDTSMRGMMTVM
jgi:hypothetical protein